MSKEWITSDYLLTPQKIHLFNLSILLVHLSSLLAATQLKAAGPFSADGERNVSCCRRCSCTLCNRFKPDFLDLLPYVFRRLHPRTIYSIMEVLKCTLTLCSDVSLFIGENIKGILILIACLIFQIRNMHPCLQIFIDTNFYLKSITEKC